ncbi:MAG: GTP-binding protein [Candidatus Pacebacteria bacterium]|nr:GTP-binding protein [Candidatus Paceibacterota bacterium]
MENKNIRNVVIIAHVDHGKTTLVDGLLKQTHTFRDNQSEMQENLILDSNALEKEKGITILAKNTAIKYKGVKINIVDTPGHADFSGEVERVINMVEGAILLVDAAEGPLPQTKFVLRKAFKHNLKVILAINKIDRKDAMPREMLKKTEELFLELAQNDSQLNLPIIYTIGREGKAYDHLPTTAELNGTSDLTPLLDTIIKYISPPLIDLDQPFKMIVNALDFDSYKGKYAIGKISHGKINKGDSVNILNTNGKVGSGKVENVFISEGLKRVEVPEALSGEIVALTGISEVKIGETLAATSVKEALPSIEIGQPTLKVAVGINTSAFAGKEGKFFTAMQIGDRLAKEKATTVGLEIEANETGRGFIVAGRGELHLAIFIETLRREGFELEISKPEVIYKTINGKIYEPFEEVVVEVGSEYIGFINKEMTNRRAELIDMKTEDNGLTRFIYYISSRNFLGFRNEVFLASRGTAIITSQFLDYFPKIEKSIHSRTGALISSETGRANSYGLNIAQKHGPLFVDAGDQVYEGMIVGINNRGKNLEINVCKSKQLTNMHTEHSDKAIILIPSAKLSLEQALDFINDDELLEITPLNIRLRKKNLSKIERVKEQRKLRK